MSQTKRVIVKILDSKKSKKFKNVEKNFGHFFLKVSRFRQKIFFAIFHSVSFLKLRKTKMKFIRSKTSQTLWKI